MSRKTGLSLCVLTLALGTFSFLRAQVAGATVSGTITDQQAGAIAGAKVSIKNVATGVAEETNSNAEGAYTVPNLRPGDYEATVTAAGFSTAVSKVTLTVGAKQTMDFSLTVGQATQTVEVTGAATAVDVATSTVAGQVEGAEIRELPLNGRDWASLATLEPNVASVRTHLDFSHVGGGGRGLGMQLSVGGNRPTQNSYRLDGAIVNDYSNAGPGSVLGQNLGVDAIQEFTVLTSNYSAEYGFTSGGVINAVTRSGTNSFHGTAFDFLRNDKLDAANFFENSNGSPKGPLKQNQFGASGGWRILKDQLFLFGDYEGVRQSKGIPHSEFVPSDAVHSGIVTNLATGVATTVPVNSTIQKFLGLYHSPNGPAVNPNVGRYNWEANQATTENFYTLRGDEKLSAKDSLAATYVHDYSNLTVPLPLNVLQQSFDSWRQAAILEETHIFSGAFVNTARLGYNRTINFGGHAFVALNPVGADPSLAMLPGFGAPGITLSGTGITNLSGGLRGASQQDYWGRLVQLYDDAFYNRGKHSLKFGATFMAQQDDSYVVSTAPGNGTFTSALVTPAIAPCRQPNGQYNGSCGALVNFLTDQPRTAARPQDLTALTKHYLRDKIFGAYLQDDWRLRPNLTLNLGLRYEMQTNLTEKYGKVGDLRTIYSPSTDLLNTFFTRNPTLRNFEPRVGFAWDPFRNGKTSVRGGFGIFDVLPGPYIVVLNNAQTAPFTGSVARVGPPNTPVPAQGVWPYAIPSLAVNAPPTARNWDYVEPTPKRDYVYQYNFSIERQITADSTFTIGYVGSRGFHNPFQDDTVNLVVGKKVPGVGYVWPIPYTLGPNGAGNDALLNPLVGNIQSTMWQSRSWYNALQMKYNKRFSHGLQAQVSYTWSKSMDDSSGSAAGDTFQLDYVTEPWYDLSLSKGPSDFNVGRNLVINGMWTAPTPKWNGFTSHVLGGWQFGVITSISDGIPFYPNMGSDGSDMLGEINPSVNPPQFINGPGCTSYRSAINVGNPNAYVNPNCFGLVPITAANAPYCDIARSLPGTCFNIRGNVGRDTLIGPGLLNTDFSIFKNNYIRKISETFNVQFRAELFNVLNRTNFGPPNANSLEVINSAGQYIDGFARITATQTPARQIQFALKLIW